MPSNTRNHEKKIDLYEKIIERDQPKKLTIKQLRSHKGLENVDDETAKQIIESLYVLSIIICKSKIQKVGD